ncbi:hypothetical protein BgiMline_023999, partial [Biomphalaria glabrata]
YHPAVNKWLKVFAGRILKAFEIFCDQSAKSGIAAAKLRNGCHVTPPLTLPIRMR